MTDNKIYIYAHTHHYEDPLIVELAGVDGDGEVLFSYKIKPQTRTYKGEEEGWVIEDVEISYGATQVHGIDNQDLVNEKTIFSAYMDIYDFLDKEEVVAYSSLTIEALRNSLRAYKLPRPEFKSLTVIVDEFSDLLELDWGVSEQARSMGLNEAVSAKGRAELTRLLYPILKAQHDVAEDKRYEQWKIERALQDERDAKAEKKRQSRARTKDKKLALVRAKDGQEMPYYGLSRPEGYITISQLKIADLANYEYAGTCCDCYGNSGYLFKPVN